MVATHTRPGLFSAPMFVVGSIARVGEIPLREKAARVSNTGSRVQQVPLVVHRQATLVVGSDGSAGVCAIIRAREKVATATVFTVGSQGTRSKVGAVATVVAMPVVCIIHKANGTAHKGSHTASIEANVARWRVGWHTRWRTGWWRRRLDQTGLRYYDYYCEAIDAACGVRCVPRPQSRRGTLTYIL